MKDSKANMPFFLKYNVTSFFLIEWSMNALKTLLGKELAAASIN